MGEDAGLGKSFAELYVLLHRLEREGKSVLVGVSFYSGVGNDAVLFVFSRETCG